MLVFGICAALGAFMLWRASRGNPAVGLSFNSDVSIPGLFGSLFLISLFVERVIEVFISVWSDRQTSVHEQNLDYWQARQGRLAQDVQKLIAERDGTPSPDATRKATIDQLLQQKRTAIEEADANADVETKALLPFEARTRKISTWIGLVVGIFASAVGFRFLTQIVNIDHIYDPTKNLLSEQFRWFVAADVLLTGAVLAGGSKLVHQIFSVYESFMESSQKSLSDKSKTQ
jgi:hypothetical protein